MFYLFLYNSLFPAHWPFVRITYRLYVNENENRMETSVFQWSLRRFSFKINFPFSLLNIPVLRPRSNGVQYWLWIPERSFAKTRGRRNTRQTVSSSSFHNKTSWRHLTLWICWVLGGLGGLWGEVLSSRRKVANSRRMGSSWGESYVYKGI